ncbi:splicing regulatory glutamine/lysine-rich protein 1-like [Helianthus annuus]|uniref:splicing regulatory glutamine/lysine-rich protein 1-like n=1 Tax=Helianthus annuus TaxID=4232 RepID=UPI0016534087|nr:splicing regulatory glutamine/lysine-rich protein 1-like [Helianthus annuus]
MEKLKEKRVAKERQKESESDVQNVESGAEKITEVVKDEEKAFEEDTTVGKKIDTEEETSKIKNFEKKKRISLEEEEKSSFRKQSNREFLAKKQDDMKNEDVQKKESRTCVQCNTIGHIAKDCSKRNVSSSRQSVGGRPLDEEADVVEEEKKKAAEKKAAKVSKGLNGVNELTTEVKVTSEPVHTMGETTAYSLTWDELKELMRKRYCSRGSPEVGN